MTRARWALAGMLASLFVASLPTRAAAEEKVEPEYWNVDDVQAGMTGYGITVLKGTQTERFLVEVIGVLKNFSPGRDMILVRVAGLGLEKTGVIAGMSGSPVFVNEKLLGAIAFTWPFGKEPIGGITPFSQMIEFAKPMAPSDDWISAHSSFLLDRPLAAVGGGSSETGGDNRVLTTGVDSVGTIKLTRIQTPLAASGFSEPALAELGRILGPAGMLPIQGGGASPSTLAEAVSAKIEPGGAMAVGLVTGDVSMSAIGTVTAVFGNRIYGFGHPFFGSGPCEFPLSTAFIHTVIPRQTVSSKMGSALNLAGKVDADVSTCVAGWLGQSADMVPVSIRIKNHNSSLDKTFRCEIVRDRLLLAPLTMTALGSCADMEGQAPVDLTAKLDATVEIEGMEPFVIRDVFSGSQFAGGRGLLRVFTPVANLLSVLANNPYRRPRVKSVTCSTEMADRDQSARLVRVRVPRPILEAGETLTVVATLQPMARPRGPEQDPPKEERVTIELKLPEDLPPGKYSATLASSGDDFRGELALRRHLANPSDFEQLRRFLQMQLALKRTDLVLRFNLPTAGVAIEGTEFAALPASVQDILSEDTSGRTSPLPDSLVERKATTWVIEGLQQVRFEVVKDKEFYE